VINDPSYPWIVRAYYARDVELPKRPGGLATETSHQNEISMLLEEEAANARPDIGLVTAGLR
jgi:hypothetical protein